MIAFGYWRAQADPIVRRTHLSLSNWPENTANLRIVLISDLHVISPDMSPARLTRIVGQINALKPDIVMIAGDLISGKRFSWRKHTAEEAVAPLAGLRPRFGTVAVLGNHDYWHDGEAFRRAVPRTGIRLLLNEAVKLGPVVIGGADDVITENANLKRTLAAMDVLGQRHILLTHSPDMVPDLPGKVDLVAAGHTHCGQISLPFRGPIAPSSIYGMRFNCGLITDNGQQVLVTAGLGTSIVPLRIGAPPDLWVIDAGR